MARGAFTTNEAAEEEPANALIAGAQQLVPGQEHPGDEVPGDHHRLHRDWLILGGPVLSTQLAPLASRVVSLKRLDFEVLARQ
ncbi:hypothetical protein [Corynebacterium kozikiae]|uniref:hypothetical protein n=1 Tax=Corynebacterium kozikiae TaxID=2968469 RepID=UPI00211CB0A1|nr:hypothetical protein [Corynebacterium sp. 76QC2CO]MCQ9343927.1 hypothetical protein [Corynebacterium sp. 76QC2CO]